MTTFDILKPIVSNVLCDDGDIAEFGVAQGDTFGKLSTSRSVLGVAATLSIRSSA